MEERNIVYLNTRSLYNHPLNPRRELGSLMELAASIRANGVMQNLTVVPVAESGVDENETPAYNGSERCFYVLIGNRRLAAAKLEGTEQVPCVIRTGLSLKDQVAIMLTENMQRSDLTVYEQAKGIQQMMMDFGETVEGIARKTGLSRTTVERRKRLADLPEKEFKKAEGKGATLMDLEKVAKVKSEKVRRSLLTEFGTNNFEWNLNIAIKQEKANGMIDGMVKVLEGAGIERKDNFDFDDDTILGSDGMGSEGNIQKKLEVLYTGINEGTIDYYCVSEKETVNGIVYKGLMVMRIKENTEMEEKKEEKIKEKERKEDTKRRKSLLTEAVEFANERRMAFIKKITEIEAKEIMGTVLCYFTETVDEKYSFGKWDNPFSGEGIRKKVCESMESENSDMTLIYKPASAFLMMVFIWMNEGLKEWNDFADCDMIYSRSEDAWRVYRMLNELGYEIADDEKAMLEGKADYYRREVEDDEA